MLLQHYLKSNMDRFIDKHRALRNWNLANLKSNMDRFIASFEGNKCFAIILFKIQYG